MEDIKLYQIIILALSMFMIYQGFAKYIKKEGGQTLLKLLVRIIVWGGMAMVILFHGFTNSLADLLGIQGNVNAVILSGFLVIFLLIFKMFSMIERLEQNISLAVRNEALKDINNKKN